MNRLPKVKITDIWESVHMPHIFYDTSNADCSFPPNKTVTFYFPYKTCFSRKLSPVNGSRLHRNAENVSPRADAGI